MTQRKSTVVEGLTIAELNTAQVEKMLAFGRDEHGDPTQRTLAEWEGRKWTTITLAVNNAQEATAPTEQTPEGDSVTGMEALRIRLGYNESNRLHSEIMDLCGLKTSTVAPGELKATE